MPVAGAARVREAALVATLVLASVAGAAPPGPPAAAAARDVAGIWLGTLELGSTRLRVAFTITRGAGGLGATFDSLDQNARGLPVASISFSDETLRAELPTMRARFEGRRTADGRIAGTFTQGPLALPLTLARVDALPVANRPQTPKPPFPYRTEEVTVVGHGATRLAGTLTLPAGKPPFRAVVLLTGTGAQDRDETLFDHKPFLVLADALTRRGVATLRLDDRGVGGSGGSTPQTTTDELADDALAAVRFLERRPEIGRGRVGLLGHSEGGTEALLAAARGPEVRFLVLLAPMVLPGRATLEDQLVRLLEVKGIPPAIIDAQRRVQAASLDAAAGDPAGLEARLRAAWRRFGDDERASAGGSEELFVSTRATMETRWFQGLLALDPRVAAARVRCPIWAAWGALDLQVNPTRNQEALLAAARTAGNRAVVTRIVPGLNHLFQHARTGSPDEYPAIEETLAPEVVAQVVDFVSGLR